MKRFLVHWLVIALALWVTAYILPGVNFDSTTALAIAAIVLGLINAIIRPILTLLTLPITILTLGLFYLLVNGFTFFLASKVVRKKKDEAAEADDAPEGERAYVERSERLLELYSLGHARLDGVRSIVGRTLAHG